MSEQLSTMDAKALQMMETNGEFEIAPCEGLLDFEDKSRFTKLELGSAQKYI